MNFPSPSTRAIQLVHEMCPSGQTKLRIVSPWLDSLDAKAVALARRRSHSCAHCSAPVQIRVRSIASCGDTGGRRAHFAHIGGTGEGCPAIAETCDSVGQVQANRFDGRQEGERHFHLKTSLAAAIVKDPMFKGAGCEIPVRAADKTLRRPDVLAVSRHGPVAFDVQLSSPLIDTIGGRDQFYDPAWMPHVWIIDGQATQKLSLQGFQDLAAGQGWRILAWDEDCEKLTRHDETLTMKVVTVSDQGTEISSMFEYVSGAHLLELFGVYARPPAISADLHALACFDAVTKRNPGLLADLYNMRLNSGGQISAQEILCSGILPLLGALMTLFRGVVSDGSGHMPHEIGAMINNALNPAFKDRRHRWARVIETAIGQPEAASSRAKLGRRTPEVIQRALAATSEEDLQALLQVWAPVLRRLFPSLASRL